MTGSSTPTEALVTSLERPTFSGLQRLDSAMADWAKEGKQRQLRPFESLQGLQLSEPQTGRLLLDFCGNDYLGLSQHPAVRAAVADAVATLPTSTTSSRLIRGSFEAMRLLEQRVAEFVGAPAALVFNTGYQANVGLLSTVLGRHDRVFSDRLNHASLLDGLRLAGVKAERYAHADMADLARRLASVSGDETPVWVISESVFSMDGDCVDIKALFTLAEQHQAWLILDEAHGVGVYGDSRRSGLLETLGLTDWPDNVIVVGTFSKALGSYGAYVAAHPRVIELLINRCRSFIYSTSLPPAVVAANLVALQVVMTDASPTQALWRNIRLLEMQLNALGAFESPVTLNSPICPILLGANDRAMAVSAALDAAGFYVQGIRPPTVPEGTARLRVTLSALHSPDSIEAFVSALKRSLK